MLKRLLVVGVVVAGCQGPESFRARFSDAGTSTGPGVGGSFGGTGVLPIMVTGEAGTGVGSVGAGGSAPDPLAGAAGGTVAGVGGSGGSGGAVTGASGAGGNMMASAGATGTAGAAGGSAGTGVVVDAGAGGGGRSGGGVDAGAPEVAQASVAYSSTNWKPTASITAAGNADSPPNAFDGKLATRWTTGRNQMGDESFVVNLGQTMSVSRVVLDDTTHPLDFPAAYTLEVSTNGTTFTAVKMGKGAATTDIQFSRVNARYVRIRQTGMTPAAGSWWSIDELKIFS